MRRSAVGVDEVTAVAIEEALSGAAKIEKA
jgi:hypothetical protein